MSCSPFDIGNPEVYLRRDGSGRWLVMQTQILKPGVVAGTVLTQYACHALMVPTAYVRSHFTPANPEDIAADFLAERVILGLGPAYSIIEAHTQLMRQLCEGHDLFALLSEFHPTTTTTEKVKP